MGLEWDCFFRAERIVLPEKLRPKALDIAHRGHPGIVAMRRNLREKVWWPCMDRDIVDRIQDCAGCAAVSNLMPPERMYRKEIPDRAYNKSLQNQFPYHLSHQPK